jgi:hypothetical protein
MLNVSLIWMWAKSINISTFAHVQAGSLGMLWVPTKPLNIQLVTDQAQALVEYSTVFHICIYQLRLRPRRTIWCYADVWVTLYTTRFFGRSVAAVVKKTLPYVMALPTFSSLLYWLHRQDSTSAYKLLTHQASTHPAKYRAHIRAHAQAKDTA